MAGSGSGIRAPSRARAAVISTVRTPGTSVTPPPTAAATAISSTSETGSGPPATTDSTNSATSAA